jgi:DNA methylase
VPIVSHIGRLDRIDWDFPRTGTAPGSVHTVHWFPGNFIPQIPAALIQVLSEPGELVLDPFGGSGTTAVEAIRLGRRAIISDRMSPCTLITAAKLAMLNGALDRRTRGELLARLTFEHQCRSERFGSNGEGADPVLVDWYAPDTLAQLRYLWSLVEAYKPQARKVLTAVFSDVLFNCASTGGSVTRTGKTRRHHWGWVADNVLPRSLVEHNAIELFRDRIAGLDEFPVNPLASSTLIIEQDARQIALQDSSVDLVVTSPPYIGMIDYISANRLLYYWMGWSMDHERQREIGARFRRHRHNVVGEYLIDMCAVRQEIQRVLRSKSFCAIVLGESKRFPGTVDRVLADFGQCIPLVWGPVARHPTRRRVSDRAARDAVELVCVFRKP